MTFYSLLNGNNVVIEFPVGKGNSNEKSSIKDGKIATAQSEKGNCRS